MLQGKVVKTKMQKTAVVAIESRRRHPLYRKIIKKTTRIKVDTGDFNLQEGETVKIQEVRPISRDKHFKIVEVVKV